MSVEAVSWVFKHSKSRLGTLLVALAIADFANDDGESWPAVSTLAKKSRQSERQVQSATRRLVKLGELTVELGVGFRGTNLYRLAVGQTQLFTPAESAPRKIKQKGVQNTVKTPAESAPDSKILRESSVEPSVLLAFGHRLLQVTPVQDQRLADVYPWVNRQFEYKKAALWRETNGAGRTKNVLSFLQNWFNKIPCPVERRNGKNGQAESFAEKRSRTNAENIGEICDRAIREGDDSKALARGLLRDVPPTH